MPGDEEAENFFLRGQASVLVPVGNVRQLVVVGFRIILLKHAKQAVLAGFGVALRFLRPVHRLIEHFN